MIGVGKYAIFAIIVVVVLTACNRAMQFEHKLDRVESLINEYSDSALALMNTIDPAEPRHEERKARYALLYMQVCDKNGLDVNNDSLVALAVNYYSSSGTPKDKFLTYYYYGKILTAKGDLVRALSFLSKAENLKNHAPDTVYISRLSKQIDIIYNKDPNITNVLASQHEFMLNELDAGSKKVDSDKISLAVWVVFGVVFCGLLLFYLYEQVLQQRATLRSFADVVTELRQAINDKDSKMNELSRNLFKELNKTINLIGASFFDKENDAMGQKMLYREVKNIIEKFRQKKTQQEVETFINRYCNDVMCKLRSEVTNLEEEDYIQLSYHIVGFSSKLISLILGISDININTRKFRLKKRIEQSNVPHKDEILSCLS